jgi:outer membrane protein W
MRKPTLLLTLALPALTASPALAYVTFTWPPPVEFSLFATSFETRPDALHLQPGFDVSLGNATGFGAGITTSWNDTLSTTFTASYARTDVRLSGSAATSSSGGNIAVMPLAAMVQLRSRRFGRAMPYAEAGVTYLLVSSSTVKPALAAAGISELLRPDHIALIAGAGLEIGLKGPWLADLNVTYLPFSQSIFPATPSGQVLKEKSLDIHPLAIAAGLAYRF